MTPQDFIAKWQHGGDERRDAQPFFEDLCRLVGHQTPREADPSHEWFTYEYGATKTSGGEGWADVWKKGFFGWEAKGTHKSLEKAYEQLKMYADALQNPPLLVVSDLRTIIIHTNFTNTVKHEYSFTVAELADFEKRQLLEAVFKDPEKLRPGTTRSAITEVAASKFTDLARRLRERKHEPHEVAHFLNRLVFCMFAEDIGLLPNQLFTRLVESSQGKPDLFERRSSELFAAMHKGGDVAFENIEWFNGGLFEDDKTLRLEDKDLKVLHEACKLDWSQIEPSVFGTLFERGLDPEKRSQLGAHYTDPETIMKLVAPVVVEPWLREWEAEKLELAKLIGKATKTVSKAAQARFNKFLEKLRCFTILDPACGSGNFLYLALRSLKDIEKRILIEAEILGLGRQFPDVGPKAVKGVELNGYAAELARVTIWIGEIQWMIQNGYGAKKNPILQPLEQIENRDALLKDDGTEAMWPAADVVVGNPPFVGDKKMMSELGDEYVQKLRARYEGRVPGGADLVCYWFEKANDLVRLKKIRRAGLVATNSIRGGKNREVLKHICDATRVFRAWSDEEWVNEGAAVRVSLIAFGDAAGKAMLDGKDVDGISADLNELSSEHDDLTKARKLSSNADVSYQGQVLVGDFDVPGDLARAWLKLPANPNGKTNADVLRPLRNGRDLTSRPRDSWVVSFAKMSEADAAMYEAPFGHIEKAVKPTRILNKRESRAKFWWRHGETGDAFWKYVSGKSRYIATSQVAKHRTFVWVHSSVQPHQTVIAIVRDDDTTLGVLQSRIHSVWADRMGTSLEDRPRYTPTTCFDTFPFPKGLEPSVRAADYANDPRAARIAEVARRLVGARDVWLNPAEWCEKQPEVVPGYPDRLVAKPGHEDDLGGRTLTALYNKPPVWLTNLHSELDVAVANAYGWEWPMSDEEILRRLFQLNQAAA